MDNLHVAIVASPGISHLIPSLILGNHLAAHHHVRVTVVHVTTAPVSKFLHVPLHQLVEIVELPPVDISHLVDPSTRLFTQLCLMLRHASPLVRSAITAINPCPNALVVDLFGTGLLPIAAHFNMAKFLYIPSTAWFTAFSIYCPLLDQQIKGEYVDRDEPLQIPGCKPVRPEDLVDPMMDRTDQQYHEYLNMGRAMPLFDGILINSWENLDSQTLHAFVDNNKLKSIIKIPVHPIGPLTRPVESDEPDSKLMAWLDRQPDESVVFVSFGSGGMLSQEEITELAYGLELSKQRFVWVVRGPTNGRVDDAFLNVTNGSDGAPNYLPDGFMNRVHDVGILVPAWAPQVRILNHPAVGGFLTHCGWNSDLESIKSSVPMIAWPLYSEQKMNAAFLAEEARVAVRPLVSKLGQVVGREEIETMVRTLMEQGEGQCLREKAKQLKMSGIEALKVGGSSYRSMCEVLAKIISSKTTTN